MGFVRSIIQILAVLDIDPSLCLTVVSTCFVMQSVQCIHIPCINNQHLCSCREGCCTVEHVEYYIIIWMWKHPISKLLFSLWCIGSEWSHTATAQRAQAWLVYFLVVEKNSNCNGYETWPKYVQNFFRSPRIHWGWATLQSAIWRAGTLLLRKYDSKLCNDLSGVLLQVGGMRVVTRPRVSESEKPVEKTKEEGEEVRLSFFPSWGVERDWHLSLVSHPAHNAWYCILHKLFGVFQAFPSFCLQFKINFRFSQLKITGRKG